MNMCSFNRQDLPQSQSCSYLSYTTLHWNYTAHTLTRVSGAPLSCPNDVLAHAGCNLSWWRSQIRRVAGWNHGGGLTKRPRLPRVIIHTVQAHQVLPKFWCLCCSWWSKNEQLQAHQKWTQNLFRSDFKLQRLVYTCCKKNDWCTSVQLWPSIVDGLLNANDNAIIQGDPSHCSCSVQLWPIFDLGF
jgi:hypothetical protein